MKKLSILFAALLTATVFNLNAATAGTTPDMHDFLYFVGLNGNDTVKLNKIGSNYAYLTATFEYSTDRTTWNNYTWPDNSGKGGYAIALENAGDTVFFRAKGTDGLNATMSYSSSTYFQFAFGKDDQIAAGGNAMSLYDATCEQDSMTANGFYNLFNKATQLVSAPKLPATQLAENCYNCMFQGCTSLTTAPALPATTLTKNCYCSMFYRCTALTQAPELNATTLAEYCYRNMFKNCSSLEVDTCTGSCDGVMFEPTTTGDEPSKWNQNMFDGCQGDAKYTAQYGINLNGHYCIKNGLDYLHFVGLNGEDTVRLNKVAGDDDFLAFLTATFEYSKDRKNWNDYSWAASASPANTYQGDAIPLAKGDTVFFRAKGTNGRNATMSKGDLAYFKFAFGADDQIAAGGKIMSLYYALCGQTTMTTYGFIYLFQNAKQLVSAPKLPATTMQENCYDCMFQGCTSLTTAPALPATTLYGSCYYSMFHGCTALTTAPALPATTLYGSCYAHMFQGCTSLTQIPELKATTLAGDCYVEMFRGCSSLQVDTCTGSCDGVMFAPTTTGDEPSRWSTNMFVDCKGDAKCTATYGIKLNGHYCIKEYKEEPDTLDYLHLVGLNGEDTVRLDKTANTANNLALITATFEYSKDRKTWTEYTWGAYVAEEQKAAGAAIALNAGDTVFFRAKGTNGKNATLSYSSINYFRFAFGANDSIAAGGNAMSLYDATCEQDTMTERGFMYLFRDAKQLVSVSELKLPATKLATFCYGYMFNNCTSLTTAPALLATTLAGNCYAHMFKGCTSLTTAPELPATTLAKQCYSNMFKDCSSLQVDTCADGSCDGVKFEPTHSGTAPTSWNQNMFGNCKGTVTTPQLGGHYCIKEYVDTLDYLHFVSLKDNGTVRLNKYGGNDLDKLTATFEYSKDRKTWTEYTWGGTDNKKGAAITLANAGDTVFFRAKGTNGKNATMSYNDVTYFLFVFNSGDSIAAGGNVMSLYDATCEQDTMTAYGFCSLFRDCAKKLVSVSELKLPVIKLAKGCYYAMFYNCMKITNVPALPVTTLAPSCYVFMFYKCTSLTVAPELPATTLADNCYSNMFSNCTALTQAPELNATILAPKCYNLMFTGCSSLTSAPELKATTLADSCYKQMFKGCTNLEVDTFSLICDGVEFEPTTTGAEPTDWNLNMFTGCKGDTALTKIYGIQLGGHYCIREYGKPRPIYGRKVTNGNFGTICLDKQFVAMEGVEGLYVPYEIKNDTLYCEELTLKDVVAGGAYIFKANADSVTFALEGETVAAQNNDHMIGWLSADSTLNAQFYQDHPYYYLLANNQVTKPKDDSQILKNRAFIDMNFSAPSAPARGRLVAFGIDAATGLNQLTDSPVNRFTKMMINGQLIIMKDGKMFNAQGQEL